MSIVDGPMKKIDIQKAATFLFAREVAGKMESEARRGAPWNDRNAHARGGLHGGVEQSGDEITVYLAHGVKYGRFLETGTAPHEIRPKNKKMLFWDGASHPVKKVNHPGTKAYPIIVPTVDKNMAFIKTGIKKLWS